MAEAYAAQIKIAEKIAACGGQGLTDEKAVSDLLLEHRDAIVRALMRPPAVAGPAVLKTVEDVVFHHFYPGPLSGSTTRLANALIDAYPALQGHEA